MLKRKVNELEVSIPPSECVRRHPVLTPRTVGADEGTFLSAATRERILAVTDELEGSGSSIGVDIIDDIPVMFGTEGTPIALYTKHLLGEGRYGEVYFGEVVDTRMPVAVKRTRPLSPGAISEMQTIYQCSESQAREMGVIAEQEEIGNLQAKGRFVDSTHISGKQPYFLIAQDLIWGENYKDYCQKNELLALSEKCEMFYFCAYELLEEWHEKGFTHGDVQWANLIWNKDKKKCTFVDFGHVHALPEDAERQKRLKMTDIDALRIKVLNQIFATPVEPPSLADAAIYAEVDSLNAKMQKAVQDNEYNLDEIIEAARRLVTMSQPALVLAQRPK